MGGCGHHTWCSQTCRNLCGFTVRGHTGVCGSERTDSLTSSTPVPITGTLAMGRTNILRVIRDNERMESLTSSAPVSITGTLMMGRKHILRVIRNNERMDSLTSSAPLPITGTLTMGRTNILQVIRDNLNRSETANEETALS